MIRTRLKNFFELFIKIKNLVFYVFAIPSVESTLQDLRMFKKGLNAPITNRVKVEIIFGVYSSILISLLIMSKSNPFFKLFQRVAGWPAGRNM